jgi:hypothetical protein
VSAFCIRQRQALPDTITARKQAIRTYGIGNPTLDKYKDLWHSNHLKSLQGEESHPIQTISLYPLPRPLKGKRQGL